MSEEDKIGKISSLNKSWLSDLGLESEYNCTRLYHTVVRSPKFLKSELRLSEYKILEYNDINDLQLVNTVRIVYREVDRKKIYNNEGVD